MSAKIRQTFQMESDGFRKWAQSRFPGHRYGEWECDYDRISEFADSAIEFVTRIPPDTWSSNDVHEILYAIARDNECQRVARSLAECRPEGLLLLADAALNSDERDARWQLVVELPKLEGCRDRVETLLLRFAADPYEYVRRMALKALGLIGSVHTEALAIAAWDTAADGSETWMRMMVLSVLRDLKSNLLDQFLKRANETHDTILKDFAREIPR